MAKVTFETTKGEQKEVEALRVNSIGALNQKLTSIDHGIGVARERFTVSLPIEEVRRRLEEAGWKE